MSSAAEGSTNGQPTAPGGMDEIFSKHREQLTRMIRLRMDRRLQGRVDASDVIQEAFLEASQRFESYQENPEVPPFIWLRFLTSQKLLQFHRRHLGAKARDAGREVSLHRGAMPAASSAMLAANLIGQQTSPTRAAKRAESKLQVQEALNRMNEMDREILALRHFEQLDNHEAALILGVSDDTCYKRYFRALKRLKEVLHAIAP